MGQASGELSEVAAASTYTRFMVAHRAGRIWISVASLALGLVLLAMPVHAQDSDHIARLQVSGVMNQISAAYIEEGLRAAAEGGAVAAIIEIDSPGGELTSTDRMVKAILNSDIPVITYVSPEGARAGSAATFITLAGDIAAMAPQTNIGAASVISGTGEDLPSTVERKIVNDTVARVREIAREHGRNADWAEDAVREAASISASEAVALRPPVVDLLAADTEALLAAIDRGERVDGEPLPFGGDPLPALSGLPIEEVRMNFGQSFLHALTDPNIVFLLFTLGFYGLIAEFFHPNMVSGIFGAIALILAFIGSNSLPLNIGGLLLILLGIGLLVLELNIASYGLLTMAGIVCFVLGAFALYTGVSPPGEPQIEVRVNPILVGGLAAVTLLYFGILLRALTTMRRKPAQLQVASLVGAAGTAHTTIAPTGVAYAGGETWSARSDTQIEPGTPIRVVRVEGLELIVEPAAAGDIAQKEGTERAG
jgi:membrane-bound serine protease (ClpP class)